MAALCIQARLLHVEPIMENASKNIIPLPFAIAFLVLVALVIGGLIFYFSQPNTSTSGTPANNASPISTLYTTGTVNVRSCASSTCKSVGTYPVNTSIPVLQYGATSMSQLPDWITISYTATDGSSATGYISQSVLSEQQTTQSDATNNSPSAAVSTTEDASGASAASNPTTVADTNSANTSAVSLTTVENNLAPSLAYITCDFDNRYGSVLFTQTANGLLGKYSQGSSYFVNTVLALAVNTSYAGYAIYPSACNVQFPSGTSLYAGGFANMNVSYSGGQSPVNVPNTSVDFSQIVLPSNTYVATYAHGVNYCTERPSVNDAIVVLGWNSSGNFQTLTGAITGTSGYYDLTNVSLQDGMQGSTVISSSGCVIGQINSAGEVVDQSALSYLFGE